MGKSKELFMQEREPLPDILIEDRYVEIRTDIREAKTVIIHNYTDTNNLILQLETTIKELKKCIQ
jgi:hypothetical protein